MEDERQEAQQTIMSNEGQLSRNFVEMRLDTRPLLKDIHEFLSAQRVILKTNADGEYYEDVVIEGKPLANNIGISRLMNLFLSLVNKDTVQGNLDKEEYYNLMVITRKELALTIVTNAPEWEVQPSNQNEVIDTFMRYFRLFI
ncbi:hypothetical protein HOC13_01480, partial [Candidatus Woesearchaeota archaeon]|nr:hypothetical protein [Candidatus Woesearchaeota archaeon]